MVNRFEQFAPEPQNRFAQFQQPEEDESRGGMAFVNRSIADVLGAPVDLINAGMGAVGLPTSETPFGGSNSIAGGMNALGINTSEQGAEPESFDEYIGRGVGGAAGMLLPLGLAARGAQAAGGVIGGVGQTLAQPFINTPIRATAAELLAGAGAGAGEAAANALAPDNPWAEMAGGLVGGIAGGMGPMAVRKVAPYTPGLAIGSRLAGAAMDLAKGAVFPFTDAGGRVRASGRLLSLAEDPAAARAALDGDNPGGLSPATQTGDRRLMALEQAMREGDPEADMAMRQQEANASTQLQTGARDLAEGQNVEATRQFIEGRLNNTLQNMERGLVDATERANARIAELTPQRRASESSTIMREELEGALQAARQQENQLWSAIPNEVEVPVAAARDAFLDVLNSTSRAQLDNIPARARQFLDPQSNARFDDFETIHEMHGLYSALREDARIARAAGERNTARIADDLANAIMEDMGGVSGNIQGPAGQAMRQAVDFSRELNQTFTQGDVGRVLRTAREGGARVPAELTLETTVGRGGLRGAVSVDELTAATQGSENATTAMRDYMLSRFRDHAVRDGNLDPRRAQDFLRQNDELLDRFPALKAQLTRANEARAEALSQETRTQRRAAALRDPRQSRAAMFLNAPPNEEIQAVIRSRNPGEAAAELVRQTANDPTGNAARGLKGALLDELMDRARTAQFDDAGENVISGRRLLNLLSDRRIGPVADAILTGEDRQRLNRIIEEFTKLETAQSRLPGVGGVMNDLPNNIISLMARTMAARVGARAGQGTSGASLLTANFATRRMQRILETLTNDKAESLLREALTGDRDLFVALLTPGGQLSRQQENRIIETILGLGGQQAAETASEFGNQVVVNGANEITPEQRAREEEMMPL